MSSAGTATRAPLLAVAAALVLGTLALYAPVRSHEFLHYDDDQYVTANPMVADGLSATGLRWAFGASHAANWHPLTWLSHMLDVQLFGMQAGPHLLVNAALHAANVLLLFLFLFRTTGELGPSAVAAALFAAHPLQVESVAWLSERKEVLSTFFGLLTLHAYVGHAARPSASRYAATAACYGASLLSKAMWITAPVLLLLVDYWPLSRLAGARTRAGAGPAFPPRTAGRLALEKLPLLGMALAAAVLALLAQARGGAVNTFDDVALGARLTNAIVSSVEYLQKAAWPVRLSALYPLLPGGPPTATFLGALTVLAAVTTLVALAARPMPWLAMGWAWYATALVPVIGVVQLGSERMADRYTYVPLIGVYVAVAWTFAALARRGGAWGSRAYGAGAAAIVLALAASTGRELAHWHDQESLFRRAVEVTGSARAHHILSQALDANGRTAEAVVHAGQAATLDPLNARAQRNLGYVLYRAGRVDESILALRRAIAIEPRDAEAHGNLAIAYGRKGWSDLAMQEMVLSSQLRAAALDGSR
jgi:tetratricopeptide (TPR) repeat protein